MVLQKGSSSLNKKTIRRRTRNGVVQFQCKTCSEWKPKEDFPPRNYRYTPSGIHGSCRACMKIQRRVYRLKNKEKWLRDRYARDKADRQGAREFDKIGRPAVTYPRFVQRDILVPMIEALMTLSDGDSATAAHEAGTTSRTLYAIRVGERDTVRWALAERIAIAAHMHEVFLDSFPLGRVGWNRAGDRYCRHCGRSDLRHAGHGYCLRCYQTAWSSEKKGHAHRQPLKERWMRSDEFMRCIRCKSFDKKHEAHGLCTACFSAVTRRQHTVPDAPLYRKHIERRRAAKDASRAYTPALPSSPAAAANDS